MDQVSAYGFSVQEKNYSTDLYKSLSVKAKYFNFFLIFVSYNLEIYYSKQNMYT